MGLYGLIGSPLAFSESINVYLKLTPNNSIHTLIQRFNTYLDKQGLLTKYQLEPYLDHFPLHITLYLAEYRPKKIPLLVQRVEGFAKYAGKPVINSGHFTASSTGYVMLTVDPNHPLQQLSDHCMRLLFDLRDTQATIPSWAANDAQRQALFEQFGSPNVLRFFNPHFSVFDPQQKNQSQEKHLYERLQTLIAHFEKKHHHPVSATAYAIGVGIADAHGQIIKELAEFQLPNPN